MWVRQPRSALIILGCLFISCHGQCEQNITIVPRTANITSSSIAKDSCSDAARPCVGDITHWPGGLGACGWQVDSDRELGVALSITLMGQLSNSDITINPYCGRRVTLRNPISGTFASAVVVDKCMGCSEYAIDLTNLLFQTITNGVGDGREHGFEWWFSG